MNCQQPQSMHCFCMDRRATCASLWISYAITMHAKVTRLHHFSHPQMMHFNSTSDESITRWRFWVHSHEAKPVLWRPDGNGWQLKDNKLESVLFEKDAAPKEIRDLTHLYCTDVNCSQNRACHCLTAGLRCTEFCSCVGDCQNTDNDLVLCDSSDEDSGWLIRWTSFIKMPLMYQ